MEASQVILPAAIAAGALILFATVALVLRSRRSREQDKLTAAEREALIKERREGWRRRLAVISLGVAFVIIFCIAGIAAWLSFGAQQQYAFDRNGGSWSAATGFALLLDAGALGLSLMRLFEALTARSSKLTRLYLVIFIIASATMNLLHAPHDPGESPSLGGRLVAVIPPLVYAIFLETLLTKVEQLVLGKYPKKKTKKSTERGYSLLLWVPFVGYPRKMWKQWRKDLLGTLQYVRAPGSRKPVPAPASEPLPAQEAELEVPQVEPRPVKAAPALAPISQSEPTVPEPRTVPVPSPAAASPAPSAGAEATGPIAEGTSLVRAGAPAAATPQPPARPEPAQAPTPQLSGDKSKKELLFEALTAQIHAGDTRVLDRNSQVSNGAAYRANMQLGKIAGKGLDQRGRQEGLLADGAVRSNVKQLLPELRKVAEEAEQARRAAAAPPQQVSEPTPEHQPVTGESTAGGDETREPQRQETLAIAQQRSETAATEETKEAALA